MQKAKYAKCDTCPLMNPIHTLVPSYGERVNPQLIVVGEGPGPVESAFGRPIAGASGELLNALLVASGYDPEQVFYTNATLCYPRMINKDDVLGAAVVACSDRLKFALQQVPADVPVLALGKFAQEALGIQLQDRWEREKLTKRWAIATLHPAWAMREPNKAVFIERTIQKLKQGVHRLLTPDPKVVLVERWQDLPSVSTFDRMPFISVDIETNTVVWNDLEARILLLGMGNFNTVVIITEPVLHTAEGAAWLQRVWKLYAHRMGGHNFKFDVLFNAKQLGLPLTHGFDTMLMVNQINEYWYKGLKDLAIYYYDADDYAHRLVYSWLDENIKVATRRTFDKVPQDRLVEYLSLDIYYTSRLEYTLSGELMDLGRYEAPYEQFEIPLSNMLAEVEQWGFAVDTTALKQAQEDMKPDIEMLRIAVENLTGGAVKNPGSPKQVADYLYGVLKLKHTVKGQDPRSTAKPVLDALAETHRVAKAIQAYRRVAKLKSSYLDNLWNMIWWHEATQSWRAHPSYKLAHVITGRLSAVKPAIQTIPNRNDDKDTLPDWLREYLVELGYALPAGGYGERIKNAYVAAPGYTLVGADGSQWEVRVMSVWPGCQDDYLIEACRAKDGVHGRMCDIIFGEGKWSKAERTVEKRTLFAVTYGGTVESAVSVSELTFEQKQRMFDAFDNKLIKFKQWRENLYHQARTKGYIVSPYFNQMFHFDLSTDGNQRDLQKQAINYPVQGTASRITSDAAVHAQPRIKALGGSIVALVHDWIGAEVPIGKEREAATILEEELSAAGTRFSNLIPWTAEGETGPTWAKLKAFN